MELPAARYHAMDDFWYYTDEQMKQVILDALEKAATICEDEICSCCWSEEQLVAAEHLASRIREVKEQV